MAGKGKLEKINRNGTNPKRQIVYHSGTLRMMILKIKNKKRRKKTYGSAPVATP
jgi:hypothetical protein